MTDRRTRVFGFAGSSGAGKTSLIEALLPRLRERGLRVSLIKHTHHDFDIDRPGKDSFRFREAGAQEVLLASDRRWALMHELREAPEPSLEELLGRLADSDLVLVEGFKSAGLPKIEVFRPALGRPLACEGFPDLVAIACDVPIQASVPVLDLNDSAAILEFVLHYLEIPC